MTPSELTTLKKSYNTLTTIDMLLAECWPDNEEAQRKIDIAEEMIKQAAEIVHYCLFHAELERYNEIMNNKKQIAIQ